jgi:hypothetical protein
MAMSVRDFMPLVLERTLVLLPPHLRNVKHSIRSVWLQLHYHTPRVHYEVWLARKAGRIEIGLHFEGPREFSYLWAERLAPYMPEVSARLGPQVELEEWTASWTRLHQTIPYDPLSEALAEEVAIRLSETIITLQPIVETELEHVPPELELAEAPGSRHSGRRARYRRAH